MKSNRRLRQIVRATIWAGWLALVVLGSADIWVIGRLSRQARIAASHTVPPESTWHGGQGAFWR